MRDRTETTQIDVDFVATSCDSSRGAERLVVHAYCLMDNHFHAIVETHARTPLAHVHTPQRHARAALQRRHGRAGHLFQDRFHARVIRDDEHLADACAYTWNNPVRAGLCDAAKQWPWSGRVV